MLGEPGSLLKISETSVSRKTAKTTAKVKLRSLRGMLRMMYDELESTFR